MLMPTVANGQNLDWHIAENRGENLGAERSSTASATIGRGRRGCSGYLNHAAMGSYADAIASSEDRPG